MTLTRCPLTLQSTPCGLELWLIQDMSNTEWLVPTYLPARMPHLRSVDSGPPKMVLVFKTTL